MNRKQFMKLYAIPLDIEKRQRRIAQLEKLQANGPQVVADVVKSSTGEGNATINCNATVRGVDKEYLEREQLIRQLEQLQVQSRTTYDEGVRLIESCADTSVRVTLQVVCLEGGSYKDAACEYRRKYIPADADALRKKAWKWVCANIPENG